MPLLTNTSTEDVGSARLDVHLSPGGTQEVSDAVAAEFVGHAYITVSDSVPVESVSGKADGEVVSGKADADVLPADETPAAAVVETPVAASVEVDGFQHIEGATA